MTEKAVPTITVRPSLRRAPTIVSVSDGDRGHERRDSDADEVDVHARHHVPVAERVDRDERDRRRYKSARQR